MDAAMLEALGEEVVRPPFLCYLDILGDPVRATTWETSVELTGTADPDLDGHAFLAVSPTVANVGPVTLASGGSDTLTVTLSGIVGPDSDLLDLLGDPTKYKGRLSRLWFILLDATGTRIGGVAPYYTGRMMTMAIAGSSDAQTVELTIENWLASLTSASNRSYLDQGDFDPTDQSAALTAGVVNGVNAPSGVNIPVGGGGSSGFGAMQSVQLQ